VTSMRRVGEHLQEALFSFVEFPEPGVTGAQVEKCPRPDNARIKAVGRVIVTALPQRDELLKHLRSLAEILHLEVVGGKLPEQGRALGKPPARQLPCLLRR